MASVSKVGRSFEITADDGQVAGHTDFRDNGEERVFYHTEIDENYGGQGLAGTLVREALSAPTAEGKAVVAVCPFVKGWLEKHPDFDVEWRRPRPADITWLKEQL